MSRRVETSGPRLAARPGETLMKKRFGFAALVVATLLAAPAYAETDAGSVPQDATGTSDAGSTDAGSTDAGSSDTSSGDVGSVDAPDATTATGFTVNPCWDQKCKAEIDSCKKNKGCVDLAGCILSGKAPSACSQALKTTKESADLFTAIQNCGYKACNDPNAGTCAAPGKGGAANRCGQFDDNWKCNCDDACKNYNDCCADRGTVCGGGAGGADSCKGKCGTPYDDKAKCQCDEECAGNKDCCSDYDKECGDGGSGGCTPKCDGKQCGADGCGGSCGVCPSGANCSGATGMCVGGGGNTDAGAGGGADSGTADGGGAASDTGASTDGTGASDTAKADGGTGVNQQPAQPSAPASTNCSAAPQSQGASSMLLVVLALAGAILLRRRVA